MHALTGTAGALLGVSGAPPFRGDVWAVGTIGRILHSTGNGIWLDQTGQGGYDISRALDAVTSGPGGVAAGESGLIVWNNSTQLGRIDERQSTLDAVQPQCAVVERQWVDLRRGNAGTILESTDAGLHWYPRASKTTNNLLGSPAPAR